MLLIFAVWRFWPRFPSAGEPPPGRVLTRTSTPASLAQARETSRASSANAASLAEDFPLAASLNAPHSNIHGDLDTLRIMLEAWRSNFPRDGNPVGENAEITAALAGDNRLALALIPKNHPAINARGELCDRWGTPFRFHQLSGEHMEFRSAGPDKKFGTADDALESPNMP